MADLLNDELYMITAGTDPELHHALDPLDVDNGPFQELAFRSAPVPAEGTPETGPVPV